MKTSTDGTRQAGKVPKLCESCSRPFWPVRSDALSCSQACKKARQRRRMSPVMSPLNGDNRDITGDTEPPKLRIVPITFAEAVSFVQARHRHHRPPIGHKFSIGVADEQLHGVATIGRPVARMFDDGLTLEVTRTATDGTPNANSMLYGAAWRATKALGYSRLITYTQAGETGASLRAAGWRTVAERPARAGWNNPSRPREDRGVDGITRTLWEAS